jgi:hypothetical protein
MTPLLALPDERARTQPLRRSASFLMLVKAAQTAASSGCYYHPTAMATRRSK